MAGPLALLLLGGAEAPGDASGDGTQLPVPLGAFATDLDADQAARTANIALAAERLDGACILPGEVLSFDAAVGPRRPGDGYLMAPAILDGEKEMAPGGGVCQLATTLYNAALLAGLPVVERHPHGRRAAYVPPGRDATVARHHKDLRLGNDLGQPVQVRSRLVGSRLVVSLHGLAPTGRSVTLETRALGSAPPDVLTFRVTTHDGETSRELLSRDVYR